MGVRGLTSFIARHAEQYLTPYELHDCYLIIDGDNLACNLYKDVTGTCSAFGGDYDDYYRAIVGFFHVLAECNVQPYVLMDGGYEERKLRTVAKRLRGKISCIKRINPCGSTPVFPLLMKEVFIDAVRDCGIPVMRCVFEADDELAALGRILKCPVLSYDSDFYIYNVRYIPLITVTVQAHTKYVAEGDGDEEQPERRLRKNEAKHMEKRTKSNKIMGDIQVNKVEKRAPKHGKTYKYLDCCIYRVENLISRGSLSSEKVPLFAALLGNDYIARSAFKNFFQNGLGKYGRSRKMNNQQRRIRVILKWLKQETSESALQKILTRLKKSQRDSLMEQVAAAISGYSNEKCRSYTFFVNNFEDAFTQFAIDENTDNEEEVLEEEELDVFSQDSDEDEVDDEVTNENANVAENDGQNIENVDNEEGSDLDEGEVEEDTDIEAAFPAWFLEKLYPAHLTRFFVDLMHLRKYINSPQIEHFPDNDCNEIALPILIYTYTLLCNAEVETTPNAEKSTDPVEFTYLARAPRVSNIRYTRYPVQEPPKYTFNPRDPNPLLFRRVFETGMQKFDTELLFAKVKELPQDLQLYFIAIVYWLQKSQNCDLIHLHALIICLVVLRTIDSQIPAERDLKDFQKRFGRIVKKERLIRNVEAAKNIKRVIKEDLKVLSIPERMAFIPKSDCYLVQDNLLKHFHLQEVFKKKYDLFSTVILHPFSEFQAVVYQLYSLNGLLNFPFDSPHMSQLYSGVFLYNLYDLLRSRVDVRFHVENFIFNDSQMMFDFYCFLWDWCSTFTPEWKQKQMQEQVVTISKKALKKRKQSARKKAAKEAQATDVEPNSEVVIEEGSQPVDDFFDLNNKFCTMLNV